MPCGFGTIGIVCAAPHRIGPGGSRQTPTLVSALIDAEGYAQGTDVMVKPDRSSPPKSPVYRRPDIGMPERGASGPRPVSAGVRIFIARDPEVVFDYFADLRNEPQYNQQVSGITKTSPGPVGQDTTFEGSHVGLGPVTWRLDEYERPKHVVIEGQVGQGAYRWTSDFETAKGGTWMNGRMEWQPPPRWRPFRRLLGVVLGWNARRSFRRMAAVLQESRWPTVP